jgi:hypothetical protein
MKRTSVLALVAMAAGLMIWGCSKSSTGPSAPSTAELIGKWVFSSVHITGSNTIHLGMGLPDSTIHTDTAITFSGSANYAQLYADMTYSMQMPAMASMPGAPASDSGAWSLAGSSLRMISTAGDTTNLSVSVSENNGTFVDISSQRITVPTMPQGSYIQSSMTATMLAAKQ